MPYFTCRRYGESHCNLQKPLIHQIQVQVRRTFGMLRLPTLPHRLICSNQVEYSIQCLSSSRLRIDHESLKLSELHKETVQ